MITYTQTEDLLQPTSCTAKAPQEWPPQLLQALRVLLSSKARGWLMQVRMQHQRVQIITKSLYTLLDFTPLQSYYWDKKKGSDETSKISNTKSKKHESDQLQQAKQVHLAPLTPVPAMF